LRLEHCFIKSNNDDAEVMEVQVGEEKKKITLAPDNDMGKSEHDMVGYKAGYDTGPVNPLPQDEREEEIYQKRKKIDDANEYFEEMKKETEEKNEQRKAVWEDAALSEAERKEKAEKRRLKKERKKAAEEAKRLKEQELDLSAYGYAADDNPDNPDNYQAPDGDEVNVFGNMIPTSKDMRETTEAELKVPGDEEKEKLEVDEKDIVHSQGNTRMVVHQLNKDNDKDDDDDLPLGPDFMQRLEDRERKDNPEDQLENDEEDMSEQNIVDMATAVAVEMEEKRRNEEWEKQKEELKMLH